MNLAQRIKQLRTELGLSQRELSKIADISNVEISRIEKGERTNPSPKNLIKLAKALKLNSSELLLLCGYLNLNEDELQSMERIKKPQYHNLLSEYLFNKGFGICEATLDNVDISTKKNDLIWEIIYLSYDSSKFELPGREQDLFLDNIFRIYGKLATSIPQEKKYKLSFVVEDSPMFTLISGTKPINLKIPVTILKLNKQKESFFEEIALN